MDDSDPLAPIALPDTLLDDAATKAHRLDVGELTTREHLTKLTAAGFTDVGIGAGAGTLLEQAAVIEAFAERSLSVAFSLWCHRMCLDYAFSSGPAHLLHTLQTAGAIGSSAMAEGFRHAAGLADLSLTVESAGTGQLRLSGRVPWASNLFNDAIVFAAAHGPWGTPVIIAFPTNAPGVTVEQDLELLALRGTASTSVTVHDVLLPEEHLIATDFSTFIRRARPVLSLLQASFCFGLANESYRHTVAQVAGVNAIFQPDVSSLGERLARAKQQFVELAPLIETDRPPRIDRVLALRLEAGVLAKQLTRLETMTAGSRGFVTTSGVNRRYREATFIPLQAPSEAQLRTELADLRQT